MLDYLIDKRRLVLKTGPAASAPGMDLGPMEVGHGRTPTAQAALQAIAVARPDESLPDVLRPWLKHLQPARGDAWGSVAEFLPDARWHAPAAERGEDATTAVLALDTLVRLLTSHVEGARDEAPYALRGLRLRAMRARAQAAILAYERDGPRYPNCGGSRPAGAAVRNALWEWLRTITGSDREVLHALAQAEVDPDEEVRRILFRREAEIPSFREGFLPDATVRHANDAAEIQDHRRAHLSLVEGWWLPRFDLRSARRHLRALEESLPVALRTGTGRPGPSRILRASAKLVLWLHGPVLLSVALVGVLLATILGRTAPALAVYGVLPGALLATGLVLLGSVGTGLPVSHLFLPRMAAGVCVGVALVVTLPSEMTRALVERADLGKEISLLAVVTWGVSFLYLLAEVTGHLGPQPLQPLRERSRRAAMVLGIGSVYALVAGLVVSLVMSGFGSCQGHCLTVLGSQVRVIPPYVFFAASVSLFGGLVLQMLWEDRGTTEPPV